MLTPLRQLLSKAIDIVNDDLSNRRLVRVRINNYATYIQSPEDTLVYTLNAWKRWRSSEDELRAKCLLRCLRTG